ncbi:MAG TPA: metal-sulfur cluster assembly factor [Actinomycetota bacterium]|nr:metal-sulfur cluster assembly factor [Actinomycetota bacterium]
MSELSERVLEALRAVYDPCCADRGISVVDMGLVRRVEASRDGARVELILTGGWCPFSVDLLTTVRSRLAELGLGEVEVGITWEEAWSPDRMSPEARRKLRFLPEPRAVRDRQAFLARVAREREEEVERR